MPAKLPASQAFDCSHLLLYHTSYVKTYAYCSVVLNSGIILVIAHHTQVLSIKVQQVQNSM